MLKRQLIVWSMLFLVGCSQAGTDMAGSTDSETERDLPVVIEPQRDADGKIVPVEKTDAQWKAELSEMEYFILRQDGTERPFTGRYHDSKADGVYMCAGCGLTAFDSNTKFESGTGWPSFYQPISSDHVQVGKDDTHGMSRDEVVCARCGGHFGHVFNDGPKPTGKRYCMDGYALRFVERATYDQAKAQGAQAEEATPKQ